MAEEVTASASEPDSLSSVLCPTWWAEETEPHKMSSDLRRSGLLDFSHSDQESAFHKLFKNLGKINRFRNHQFSVLPMAKKKVLELQYQNREKKLYLYHESDYISKFELWGFLYAMLTVEATQHLVR